MHSKILILDFGSQVTQLIARRVRDAGVFSEVFPYDVSDEFVRNYGAAGVILSGSPSSASWKAIRRACRRPCSSWACRCWASATACRPWRQQLGGKVENGLVREFGYAEVRAHGHTALLNDINDFVTAEGHGMLKVWMSHGDKVTGNAAGLQADGVNRRTARSPRMADEDAQFLRACSSIRKSRTRCRARPCWAASCTKSAAASPTGTCRITSPKRSTRSASRSATTKSFSACPAASIRSVAAALIHRAIGDQLTCVFVDHGLLRLDEGKMVMDMFAKNLGVKVIHVDADRPVHGPSGRRDRSGSQAQDHRPRIRRSVPGRSGQAEQREMAGAGHDLSGRDRKRGQGQERARPSRATTTWAACRRR